jgi:PAS domain S-box-containing protein
MLIFGKYYFLLVIMNANLSHIVFSGIAGLVLWSGDAAVDALVFQSGTFSDGLFHASAQEMFSRSLFIAGLLAVGVILARALSKQDRARTAVQESNETLFTVTDAAKDAIVMMDNRGSISFWNRAAETIFGYTAHEAIGRELHAMLAPPKYREQYQQGFNRLRDTGEGPTVGSTIELTAITKNGARLPVEISLSPLHRQDAWHAVGVLRDI